MEISLKKQNDRSSFTLLELMIVVIIIGILASIGVGHYRKVVVKAKAAKAKHAISLIAEAEKIWEIDNGAYVNFGAGVDTNVGTNVTGINLVAVDNDTDFNYSVVGNVIQASNPVAIGTCGAGSIISLNLVTGIWVIPACYR